MKRQAFVWALLSASCGTGATLSGLRNQPADSSIATSSVPDGAGPSDTGSGATAGSPNTVVDGNPNTVVADPNTVINPNAVANPNTVHNPNISTVDPNAGLPGPALYACQGIDSCIVLGQTASAEVTRARVEVNIPGNAVFPGTNAFPGTVIYGALVSNSNNAVVSVQRASQTVAGTQIEFPQVLPLPVANSNAPTETFTLYVWPQGGTNPIAFDLAGLVLHNAQDATWSFDRRPANAASPTALMGVKAVVDQTAMTPRAQVPFTPGSQERRTGMFALHIGLLYTIGPGPGSGNVTGTAMGIAVLDQTDSVVVYSNFLAGGTLQTSDALLAGHDYVIRVYSQNLINGAMSDQDPAPVSYFPEVPVHVTGDIELLSLIGSAQAFLPTAAF